MSLRNPKPFGLAAVERGVKSLIGIIWIELVLTTTNWSLISTLTSRWILLSVLNNVSGAMNAKIVRWAPLRSVQLQLNIKVFPLTHEVNLRFLSNEIQPFLASITERIHHTHPNYDLEALFAEVFRKLPGVVDVRWQRGWQGGAGDHGADILVTFEAGLPIPGLEQEHTVVVQVKSFEGEHWDTQAVEDIRRALSIIRKLVWASSYQRPVLQRPH